MIKSTEYQIRTHHVTVATSPPPIFSFFMKLSCRTEPSKLLNECFWYHHFNSLQADTCTYNCFYCGLWRTTYSRLSIHRQEEHLLSLHTWISELTPHWDSCVCWKSSIPHLNQFSRSKSSCRSWNDLYLFSETGLLPNVWPASTLHSVSSSVMLVTTIAAEALNWIINLSLHCNNLQVTWLFQFFITKFCVTCQVYQ